MSLNLLNPCALTGSAEPLCSSAFPPLPRNNCPRLVATRGFCTPSRENP